MSVPMAYIGVIIIWSTTPLAVFWSSEEVGFIFGLTSRMLIGAVLATMAVALMGIGLHWNKTAVRLYIITGFSFFMAMFLIYWAMQYIPTGWVSLLYGFMPIATALMARRWLEGEALGRYKILGLSIGLIGLSCVFSTGLDLNQGAVFGIGAVLLSVVLHAGSSVWVKKQAANLPSIVLTSGGLLVATPLFLMAFFLSGATIPEHASVKTMWSIFYLALFGSVLGFALYYYVLKHVDATRASLITLIAPIAALGFGNVLNHEPLTAGIILGAMLILGGLSLFEFGHWVPKLFRRAYKQK